MTKELSLIAQQLEKINNTLEQMSINLKLIKSEPNKSNLKQFISDMTDQIGSTGLTNNNISHK
jgi:hypothetical protein